MCKRTVVRTDLMRFAAVMVNHEHERHERERERPNDSFDGGGKDCDTENG